MSSVRVAEIVTSEPRLQGYGPLFVTQAIFLALELFLAVFIFICLRRQNTFPWIGISVLWGSITLGVALAMGYSFNVWLRSNRQRARKVTTSQDTYITGRPMLARVQAGFFGSLLAYSSQMFVFLGLTTNGNLLNFSEANHHAIRIPNLLILFVLALFAVYFLAKSMTTLRKGMATAQEIMVTRPC